MGPGRERAQRLGGPPHVVDHVNVVVLVVAVEHRQLRAVGRPLRIQKRTRAPRQPRHAAGGDVEEVEVALARPPRDEHELIAHRRPVGLAVFFLVGREPRRLAAQLVDVHVVVADAAVAGEGEAIAGGGPRDPGVVADLFGDAGEKEPGLLAALGRLVVDRVHERAVRPGDHDLLLVPAAALERDQLSGSGPHRVGVVAAGLDGREGTHGERHDRRRCRRLLRRRGRGHRREGGGQHHAGESTTAARGVHGPMTGL